MKINSYHEYLIYTVIKYINKVGKYVLNKYGKYVLYIDPN